jgi:ParB-like chromosome segregation protein Spo0J
MSGESELVQIRSIDSIWPSPENDKVYNPSDVTELVADIKKRGQLDPIVITRDGYILSGHRRYAACKRAGLKTIKCRAHNISRGDPEFIPTLIAYNNQRVKTADEFLREGAVKADPKEAHRVLTEYRESKLFDTDYSDLHEIELRDCKQRASISAAKFPLLNAVNNVINGRREWWPLSVRQIHYALLNDPPLIHSSKPDSTYRNDRKSYQAVVDICTRGRLAGLTPWQAIDDETRPVVTNWGWSSVQPFIKFELDQFLQGYYRNFQQSQPAHIEIIGEKNTVHSIVKGVASRFCIPYTIGRGYCSLIPRKKLIDRYLGSGKDQLILLVLSDFDPDGEEIAHSFARSLRDDFGARNIVPIKVALTCQQVEDLDLPPIMKAKETSSNYGRFTDEHGDDVYELEAVPPATLEQIMENAIDQVIDRNLFNQEIAKEEEDAASLESIRAYANKCLEQFSKN